jgi:hypothetical protein
MNELEKIIKREVSEGWNSFVVNKKKNNIQYYLNGKLIYEK